MMTAAVNKFRRYCWGEGRGRNLPRSLLVSLVGGFMLFLSPFRSCEAILGHSASTSLFHQQQQLRFFSSGSSYLFRRQFLMMASKRSKATTAANSDQLPSPAEWFDSRRVRCLTEKKEPLDSGRCVVYWMSRDQRAHENWALLYASALATKKGLPLRVVFCLVPKFLDAPIRHFGFMLRGMAEVEAELREKNVPFHLLRGWAPEVLPGFAQEAGAAAVVTDMSPLRVPAGWARDAAAALDGLGAAGPPLHQVDAHNIVPVWVASPKQEYAARTIRSKIHGVLPEFLVPFPELPANTAAAGAPAAPPPEDWDAVIDSLGVDRAVPEVTWLRPGAAAARATLEDFCDGGRLKVFADRRNDPNAHALSNLSPYFHYGQLSAQAAILEVKKRSSRHGAGVAAFVEEAVVRRELSDNFCFYQEHYDSLEGCSDWARESLELHAADPREHLYSLDELAEGRTHDDLWNAAQVQMVTEGKMHGFLRMYWAKKILEWTPDPATALQHANYLNDRFSLDGRDPNGYVGTAWSIMGIHDMGWKERPIFGKIRYMNYAGCKRKFNIPAFVARYSSSMPASTAATTMTTKKAVKVKTEGGQSSKVNARKRSSSEDTKQKSGGQKKQAAAAGSKKKKVKEESSADERNDTADKEAPQTKKRGGRKIGTKDK